MNTATLGTMLGACAYLGYSFLDGGKFSMWLFFLLAGVGNVWKSEILFDCQLDPRTPAAALDDAELSALLQRASELMQAHVASGATQRPVRIYGRGGRDCPVCGTVIRARAQGDEGRRTFWCPTCQPSRAAASPKNA